MGRKREPWRLEQLYRTIAQHPGRRAAEIARLLGWHRSQVTRMLPDLEEQGYLLYEDEQGRLWPFKGRFRR